MSSTVQRVQVYQLRIWIRGISPQIWRRLLVRSDSTIAELHDTLQIAFGWTDEHLHQFLIRGKPYGIGRSGGMSFDDNPHQVQLRDFHFRWKETWVYEYDLTDWWQHEIRLEQVLPLDPAKRFPSASQANDAGQSRSAAALGHLWNCKTSTPSGRSCRSLRCCCLTIGTIWMITRMNSDAWPTGLSARTLIGEQSTIA